MKIMKKLFSIAVLAIITFSISCSQTSQAEQTVNIDADGPMITFEVLEHNFGTIEKGGDGTYNFVFENNGTEPLILSNVKASCGCTTPSWPREPIPAGEKSGIKVKYDTKRIGSFNKSITITSNVDSTPVVIRIKGTVVNTAQPTADKAEAK